VTFHRRVREIRDFLVIQVHGIEFTADNHLLFHIHGALTWFGLDFVSRWSGKPFPP